MKWHREACGYVTKSGLDSSCKYPKYRNVDCCLRMSIENLETNLCQKSHVEINNGISQYCVLSACYFNIVVYLYVVLNIYKL